MHEPSHEERDGGRRPRTRPTAAGPVRIAAIERVSAQEWDQTWSGCDYATYFHSREWTETWTRLEPTKLACIGQVVVFSDGKRAVLPLLRRRRAAGLVVSFNASADGMFGGWISLHSLDACHITLIVDYLLTGLRGTLSWRTNPYDPCWSETKRVLDARCHWLSWAASNRTAAWRAAAHFNTPLAFPDVTYALDLQPGYDTLFHKKSGVLRDARKAAKEGVTIELAERAEQWDEYYQVYRQSMRRWGSDPTTALPLELFANMAGQRSNAIRLWVAVLGGKIISGALCFYAKRHVVYWHGSSLQEYFPLGPVNLLMLTVIQDACDRGYHWYDFNPSGHAPGVTTFKQKFHPQQLPCPLVYVDDPLKRGARVLLYALGRLK